MNTISRYLYMSALLLAVLLAPARTQAASTVLAVVRSGGTALLDAAGVEIRPLAAGEALTADGRTADGAWLHGVTRRGETGWVDATHVLAFGAQGLPVASGFTPPTPPTAAPADPTPAAMALATRAPGGTAAANPPRKPAGSPATAGLTGNLVFQERSGGKIHVAELPSGRTRVLTTGFDPAVSPDGKSVVFVRDDGGNELRVIGIGGSGERLLLKPGEPIRSPRWSPDGQSIVFTRVTGQKVCRIPPNVSVEGLPIGFVCLPDLPFFRTFPVQKIDEWGLSLVDAQGAGKRDLPSAPFARNPDWSARGVLYGSEAGIQVTSVGDGAESRALIPVARYGDPAWQPGGTHIAFQSLEKDHWEIFAANDDGANPVALTRPPSALETFPHNVAPAWSPDGKSLVYLSNRGGSWGLWVMNADGSNQRRLPITTPISYDYQAEQVVSWGR